MDNTRAKELYALGETDGAIGRALHVGQDSVTRWRQRNNLPPNARGYARAKLDAAQRRQIRHLLKDGASRKQISDRLGVGKSSVSMVRKTVSDKGSMRQCGMTVLNQRRVAVKNADQLYKRIILAVGRKGDAANAGDAVNDIYLAVMEGHLRPDQIESAAPRYVSRVTRQFANSFGPRSLDEEIGEDGFSMLDILEDERALLPFDEILARHFEADESVGDDLKMLDSVTVPRH